jgi:hypothetical protein
MHPKCIEQMRQHLVAGVAVVHEQTVDYVAVDTATSNSIGAPSNTPTERPRADTFEGFMSRFAVRHHGKSTEKMQAMLREAYKAGAVDGARFMAKLTSRSTR